MLLPEPSGPPNNDMPFHLSQSKRPESAIQLRALNYQAIKGDRETFWDNANRPLHDLPPYCLFQCTLSGAGYFHDTDGEHTVNPGDAFLVPVPSPTAYGLPMGERWEWIWLGFEGEMAHQLVENFNRNHGCFMHLGAQSHALHLAVSLVDDCLSRAERSPWNISSRIYAFLMALFEEHSPEVTEYSPAVLEAIEIMKYGFANPQLNLDRMAEAAGLSKYHFSRLFRECTGSPPATYLRTIRLEHARDLLHFTRAPIKEIAFQSGFGSDIHFCAAFKKHYGITPGSLRK